MIRPRKDQQILKTPLEVWHWLNRLLTILGFTLEACSQFDQRNWQFGNPKRHGVCKSPLRGSFLVLLAAMKSIGSLRQITQIYHLVFRQLHFITMLICKNNFTLFGKQRWETRWLRRFLDMFLVEHGTFPGVQNWNEKIPAWDSNGRNHLVTWSLGSCQIQKDTIWIFEYLNIVTKSRYFPNKNLGFLPKSIGFALGSCHETLVAQADLVVVSHPASIACLHGWTSGSQEIFWVIKIAVLVVSPRLRWWSPVARWDGNGARRDGQIWMKIETVG